MAAVSADPPQDTPRPLDGPDVRDEQAALRRVATAVAEQRTPDEIFTILTREIAMLFSATGASLVRFEVGDRGTVIADWSAPGTRGLSRGVRVDFHLDSSLRRVYRTGAAARIDSYPDDEYAVADFVKRIGAHAAVAAPVTVGGRIWGAVAMSTSKPRPFPAGAEAQLASFAELVALGVANAEARSQLTASRIRIVHAGDEARRRIERDLHDGAQQRLVALALHLRLARNVADDGDAVRELLDACSAELALALGELRELARGIHPAILTERGLDPALRAVADRSPVPVAVDTQLAGRLDQPQEAALYFTASEALANVAKYAHASSVSIRTVADERCAVIEIRDDGVGGADASRGSGLRGLGDRVEAVGGWLSVTSPPGGGTTVIATLPLGERSGDA
jgi:signal transduction histidine kinase